MKTNMYINIRHVMMVLIWCCSGTFALAQYSPSITTDQSDYMPGTWATFSGSGFAGNEFVSLVVNHTNGGDDATSPAHQPFTVQTDDTGAFTAQWYVPADEDEDGASLVATAIGLSSQLLAKVFFTDNLNIDFRQGANDDAGYGPSAIHWISSILQQSNSTFTEGMSSLQRVVMADIPATTGNIHSLRLSHQFTKGGHYAYDFLTGNSLNSAIGWNVAFTDYNSYLLDNSIAAEDILVPYACGEEIGPPSTLDTLCSYLHSSGGYYFDVPLPDDPFISVHGPVQDKIDFYEAANGNRYARIYGNAPITNAYFTCVVHDVPNGGDEGDSNVNYTLVVETASTNMILEIAGHLAIAGVANEGLSWGVNHGAGNISGGPYHFRLHGMGGAVNSETCEMTEYISVGAQDNQIKAGDIIPLVCDCAISGEIGPVCPGSIHAYCAPDSASTVEWTIMGNGTLSGSNNCVEVTAGDTCNAPFTVMLHVTYDNGCTSDCEMTVLVQDTISPVIDDLPTVSTINCPAQPEFTQATATDECDSQVELSFEDELLEGNCPGNYTVIRHWTAMDDCGNASYASQTINVQDITAPVFDELPAESTINCPAQPHFTDATASDECDEQVDLNYEDELIEGNCPGNYTVIRHWTAMDDCGNASYVSQTINVRDVTPPTIVCPANITAGDCDETNICLAEAEDECDGDDLTIQYNYACNYQFPVGTTTVTASTSDACGNAASCNFTVTVVANPQCSLNAPSVLPLAGSTNNTLCVPNNSSLYYAWTVDGSGWQITGGSNTACVTYTAGPVGVPATFCLVVTNAYGCSDTCCVSYTSLGQQFCTYTQGFYGGTGKNCTGVKALDVITQALSPANGGNLIIGTPASTRVLTILSSEAACLNSKMPAGTTPAVLPLSSGNVTCATATGSGYLNSGRFKSVLVGQTIALGLNLRNSSGLSGLTLLGNQLTTAKASSCNNGTPIPYSELTFCIPANVWNYLSTPKTVAKLYTLANQALGGNTPSGLSISDITAAVDAVNKAFDQCRILVSFGTCGNRSADNASVDPAATPSGFEDSQKLLQLQVYPNPMGETGTLEIESAIDSRVTVEVYSGTGQRVESIYNGELSGGEHRILTFNTSSLANGIYVCKMTAGSEVVYSTIVISK